MNCSQCGAQNSEGSKSCSSCGFNFSEADIAAKNYEAVIGPRNTPYYIKIFRDFEISGAKPSWNWPAFFITGLWLLYRKMWLNAFVYFFVAPVLFSFMYAFYASTLDIESASPLAILWPYILYLVAIFTVVPMYANYLYFLYCRQKITMASGLDQSLQYQKSTSSRPTRNAPVVIAIILVFIGIAVAIANSAYQDRIRRAQVSEGLALVSGLTTPLAEYYYGNNNSFAGVAIEDLTSATAGSYVSQVTLNNASGPQIAIVATFNDSTAVSVIKGLEIRMATEDGGESWQCGYAISNPDLQGSSLAPAKYMPGRCK